jgi:coenzyme F420-reducing hydrogenase delta subunit/ferredoxin
MLWEPGTLIRVPPDIHRKVAGKGPVSATYHARPYEISTFTARVDQHLCRGCGLCEAVCGYRAVRVIYRGNGLFTAEVDDDMCRGCGTCVPVCPSGAIDQDHFTAQRIDRMVDAELHGGRGAPPVVVFSCRWNGALRYEPPESPAQLIQVMCIGRVVPGDVLKAFEKGAKGVLMVGCADDDCHYGFGSCAACENLQQASDMLSLLGIERDRFAIVQVPVENAPNLSGLVEDFITEIRGSIKPKRGH